MWSHIAYIGILVTLLVRNSIYRHPSYFTCAKLNNVLIGANGGGKSNLASFFGLLRHMANGQLSFSVGKQGPRNLLYGGPKVTQEIKASVHFKSDRALGCYRFQLSFAHGEKFIYSGESVTGLLAAGSSPDTLGFGEGHSEAKLRDFDSDVWGRDFQGDVWGRLAHDVLVILQDCRVYHFNDTSETARVMQSVNIDDNQQLKGDFSNLPAFLYALEIAKPAFYRRIVDQIQQVAPFFRDFQLVPKEANKQQIPLNWNQQGSDELYGPEQLSDGTLRMIGMIALLMQPEDKLPQVIILDEPELGLHPFAISHLAGMIRQASRSTQIIVATQSPLLVCEFEPEDVVVVERQASGNALAPGESNFRRLVKADLEEWLKEYSLGELWMKNVIGGQPVHE